MKWFWKCVAVLVCIGLLNILPTLTAYAVTGEKEKAVELRKIWTWDNGVSISTDITGRGKENQIAIEADTIGKEKGYYAAFLYHNAVQNLGMYDGIAFELHNTGQIPLQMNLGITIDKNTSLELKDNAKVILENTDGSAGKMIAVAYGKFQIPVGFEGVVYIPFDELKDKDDETTKIRNIKSWGLTLVMEEEQQAAFTCSHIRFLSSSEEKIAAQYFWITILGSDQVVLPDAGTAIKQYHAEVYHLNGEPLQKKVNFTLSSDVQGVRLSEDGLLEVDSTCKVEQITILAKTEDGINTQELPVSISNSHGNADQAQVNGIAIIPDSTEIPSILPEAMRMLLDTIAWARAAVIAAVAILGCMVIGWLIHAGIAFKRLLKEMTEKTDGQEQEEP